MLVTEVNLKTQLVEKEIQKVISHLLIKKDGLFGTEKISLKVATSQGGTSKKIFESFPMMVAAEYTTHGEGHFIDDADGSELLLVVGENGGIFLGNDEYLQLSLENLGNTKNYVIHAIECPVSSTVAKKFEKINISEGQESKRQLTGDAHTLIVPNDIVSLELTYLNGNTIKLPKAELKAMSNYQNDLVCVRDGAAVYGTDKVFTINLLNVTSYEIFTDGSAQLFYTVASK